MPAFGVARATPQFLGRDVPLGASSRGSCGASWRGWGLWAGAGGAGEGELRASLALGLRGPGSTLSSSPRNRDKWRWELALVRTRFVCQDPSVPPWARICPQPGAGAGQGGAVAPALLRAPGSRAALPV